MDSDAPKLEEVIQSVHKWSELLLQESAEVLVMPAIKTTPAKPSGVAGVSEFETLRQTVLACTLCSELTQTRKSVVFGDGYEKARLMFVGEAPGADEDRQGLPFVGKAGQLLTKMIEAMGLKRQDVFIANILKCRPPENRTPLPTEVVNCKGYLEKQIDWIKPQIICALGSVAAQNLLNTTRSISSLRGSFHDYKGIKVVATFHPAYLLRNPDEKKKSWQDLKMIVQELKPTS
jgi:DNA polymerase